MLRRLPLILLVLALLAVAIATWGSIGSVCMILCLLLMPATVLYQKFLTNADEDLWQEE